MKIDILTLFPDIVMSLHEYGVIGKAIRKQKISLQAHNIRNFSSDKHHRVDDTVYGGAAGMLMQAPPIVDAIESVRKEDSHVIFMSPQGKPLTQEKAIAMAKKPHLIFLCGHYEGIDARVTNYFVDEELSIGDYVLTGGELPAMVVVDAVVRWIDGVLGNAESAPTDSHYNGLLQYDEFTKPRNFRGYEVPEVLLNGNHAQIAQWRKENSIENTRKKRPDLYEKYRSTLTTSGSDEED